MPSEFLTTAIVTVLDLLTTYLLHSTLLLAIAALAAWCCRTNSHALTERLWKSAAVIPLLTAPLQLLNGIGNPVFSPRWVEPVTQVVVEHSQTYASKTIGVDDSEPTSDPLPDTRYPTSRKLAFKSIADPRVTSTERVEPVSAVVPCCTSMSAEFVNSISCHEMTWFGLEPLTRTCSSLVATSSQMTGSVEFQLPSTLSGVFDHVTNA